jgi:hypothetical protein
MLMLIVITLGKTVIMMVPDVALPITCAGFLVLLGVPKLICNGM